MHSFKACKALILIVVPAAWLSDICVLNSNYSNSKYSLISNERDIKHPFTFYQPFKSTVMTSGFLKKHVLAWQFEDNQERS